MKCSCAIAVVVLSGLLAPLVQAQPQRLRFERLGVQDGLSQGEVFSIAQDSQGFMWFGTRDGLNRYDGHAFVVYQHNPYDPSSLLSSVTWDIDEGHDGALWVAGGIGVSRFDPMTETATRYPHDPEDPSSLPQSTSRAVLEGRDGAIWVGTSKGLSRMDPTAPGRFTHYVHDPEDPTSLSDDMVHSLFEDAAGHIWISTPSSLDRMDPAAPGHMTHYLNEEPPLDSWYSRTAGYYQSPEAPSVLWLGSPNGIIRLDIETAEADRYLPNPDDPGSNRISDIAPDPDDLGVLWVTVRGSGLAHFDMESGEFTMFRHDPDDPYSLQDDVPWRLLTDRTGAVWVGHIRGRGISRFSPAAVGFRVFRHSPNRETGTSVRIAYEDREGDLWIGGYDGDFPSLRRFDRTTGEETRQVPSTSIQGGLVHDLIEDQDGTLWMGTTAGLSRYDPAANRFRDYGQDQDDRDSLSGRFVYDLLNGDDGALWLATGSDGRGGIDRFDPTTGAVTRYPNVADAEIISLHKDQSGMMWAGFRAVEDGVIDQGLLRLDPATGETTRYRHDPADTTSLAAGRVNGIVERDREPGILWLALSPGGLTRFDTQTGSFTRYSTEDGLPNNSIVAVLEDDDGVFWVSTLRGIARFDPDTEEVQHFGLEHGLQGLEYHYRAAGKARDGELFFGGSNGLNAFYPRQITTNQTPPQVSLTGFRLFNEPVAVGSDSPLTVALDWTEEIRLRHDQDVLAFDFVALHYANPAENQYAYRLEGFDRDWVDAGTDRTATYTNLSPGRYTFRVKAANSDGVWNEEGVSVRLTVLPPWWRTWWAYLGYALLFMGGVFVVDRVQRRRLLEVEQRRAAGREARLRADLAEERAQVLESLDQAKSRFFANVSHEFRTPLTLLLGPIRDLIEGRIDAQRLASHAPVMHGSAQRLLRLINQLLDLSQLESGEMRLQAHRQNLVPFLRRHVLAFASHAERDGVALAFTADPEAIDVTFDPDKVEKIFSNLLSNAFKFTASGGRVRVAVRRDEGHVEITVRDTGEGIPADELPLVFDRFHQADSASTRRHEGTGIGLALAKELVELHGGTVSVESERGFGSTFTVRLPLEQEERDYDRVPGSPDLVEERPGVRQGGAHEAPVPRHEQTHGADADLGGEAVAPAGAPHVLIVEDNPDMRAYLRSQLEGTYRITEAVDGADGLRQARADPPDLVISDVMMPDMDGLALCAAIKADEALGHIPVVLLTAKADEASRIDGLQQGADDYLAKPFSTRELEVRVANLILSRAHLRNAYSGMLKLPLTDVMIPSGEEAFVQRVLEVMNQFLGDSTFTTDRLAEEVNLSRRQVERKVKALTSQTARELMQQMRLERAGQILEARPGSIAEVAYAVGFKSPSHFSVAFRRAYGHTPTEHAEGHGSEGPALRVTPASSDQD